MRLVKYFILRTTSSSVAGKRKVLPRVNLARLRSIRIRAIGITTEDHLLDYQEMIGRIKLSPEVLYC